MRYLARREAASEGIAEYGNEGVSEELAAAFKAHLEETEKHVARVEAAVEETGKKALAKMCEAMAGLIEEAKSMMEEEADPDVMDAILIGCAQKVEHYEIATYGTLCTWAELLGYKNAKKNLGANHGEEEKADQTLTKLSQAINLAAKSPLPRSKRGLID